MPRKGKSDRGPPIQPALHTTAWCRLPRSQRKLAKGTAGSTDAGGVAAQQVAFETAISAHNAMRRRHCGALITALDDTSRPGATPTEYELISDQVWSVTNSVFFCIKTLLFLFRGRGAKWAIIVSHRDLSVGIPGLFVKATWKDLEVTLSGVFWRPLTPLGSDR